MGEFEYDGLVTSKPYLGPFMFWIYTFLVFFVLMSMFIALISEARPPPPYSRHPLRPTAPETVSG